MHCLKSQAQQVCTCTLYLNLNCYKQITKDSQDSQVCGEKCVGMYLRDNENNVVEFMESEEELNFDF